jgi:hypothetical protein
MKTWTKYLLATGEIIGWSSGDATSPGDDYVESPKTGPGHPRTQYVSQGKVVSYTPAEQAEKDSIPVGWTWLVKERKAVDLRSPTQANLDVHVAVQEARAASYPPITDFIDASYWQSKGDSSKMDSYLAACTAVKEKFPKPQ